MDDITTINVEGPVLYAYCKFKYRDVEKQIHFFGDRHTNTQRCKKKYIHVYDLIKNTIKHYKDQKTIDVFAEIGFGTYEYMYGENKPSSNNSYILDLFNSLYDDGCFRRPRSKKCSEIYGDARFHNVDFRHTLLSDVGKYIEMVKKKCNYSNPNNLFKLFDKFYTNSYKPLEESGIDVKNINKQLKDQYENFLIKNNIELNQLLTDYIVSLERFYICLQSHSVSSSSFKISILEKWVQYLFSINVEQNINKCKELIENDLYKPEHVTILRTINFFNELEKTEGFFQILFHSIKMEKRLLNFGDIPYYKFLLFQSCSKIDLSIYHRIITPILTNIENYPVEDNFFNDYSFRQNIEKIAIHVTSVIMDSYAIIRLLKPMYNNIIQYEGASHIFNQIAILENMEKNGYITDFSKYFQANDPKNKKIERKNLNDFLQCVSITCGIDNSLPFLPFVSTFIESQEQPEVELEHRQLKFKSNKSKKEKKKNKKSIRSRKIKDKKIKK